MTADQAIAVFEAMATAPIIGTSAYGMESTARAGIVALIANGQMSAQHAMDDIAGGIAACRLTADQSLALIAGVAQVAMASSNPNAATVLTAAGTEINAMIASGQIGAGQAMGDIGRAIAPIYGDGQAAYVAGGLSHTGAPALLAAIMATSTDAGVAAAAAAELMTMVNANQVTTADAMNGIHNAVTSHGLSGRAGAGRAGANPARHEQPDAGGDSLRNQQSDHRQFDQRRRRGRSFGGPGQPRLDPAGTVGWPRHQRTDFAGLDRGRIERLPTSKPAVTQRALGYPNALAVLVSLAVDGSAALRDERTAQSSPS